MSKTNQSDYLAHWPMALPFPYSIKRSTRPVPNSNAVNWPQSQFAPLYLPPGSPSFQPYSYTRHDVPLRQQEPYYSTKNFLPYAQSGVGPGGDTSALPSYGDPMYRSAVYNPRKDPLLQKIESTAAALHKLKAKRHKTSGEKQRERKLKAVLSALIKVRKKVLLQRSRVSRPRDSVPVVRIGYMPTKESIPTGSPALDNCGANYNCGQPPASRLNSQRSDLGDGFAFELAPLQASAPYSEQELLGDAYGAYGVARKNTGCGCGCKGAPGGCGSMARPNGKEEGEGNPLGIALVVGTLLGVAILPTFVIEPWVIKQFKPEWGYGKRVAASLAINTVFGTATGLAAGVVGAMARKGKTESEDAPAADVEDAETAP